MQRYSMKEKYNIIESCDKTIASYYHPEIKTVSQYFLHVYPSQDLAHKFVSQYGKWNKPEHKERIILEIIGKDFEGNRKLTKSAFHQMESMLCADIVKN